MPSIAVALYISIFAHTGFSERVGVRHETKRQAVVAVHAYAMASLSEKLPRGPPQPPQPYSGSEGGFSLDSLTDMSGGGTAGVAGTFTCFCLCDPTVLIQAPHSWDVHWASDWRGGRLCEL